MSAKPCQICGCTDLNLVDGFFYCVECGTQDTNVRETVVERTIHDEGFDTFQATDTKKIGKVLKEGLQMSAEWCKWHAYNFILVGLLDELIALGAKPTVKQKALWIWLRYVKKFQKKDEPENTLFENNASNEDNTPNEDKSEDEDKSGDDEEESCKENTDSELDEPQYAGNERRKKYDPDKFALDIETVTMSVLLAIIYVALNLDRSDIQLSHLYQFMREDRLSVYYCFKFIPKELTLKSIPQSTPFRKSVYTFRFGRCKTPRIRQIAMTLMKRLDLGIPVVPDMNKITDDFIKELCLPNDFRDLVYSLTKILPCDFLKMDAQTMTRSVHIPDYETYCMAYILLGLKMCFGLDCDYEVKLSDAVDKINSEEEYSMSYKLGIHSEPTDRLFSFQEWYTFIQNRKMILCKYYLPMAILYQSPIDDCTYMEHTEHRQLQSMKLSYEVTMNILNKIPTSKHGYVIPKDEFPVTLTPLTTYTEFIKDHVDDPDLKLRLSEDFTQYSLEYATRDLKLPGSKNISEGVDTENKILNLHLMLGNLKQIDADTKMVLVRHCDNKHWLKTKPPLIKHVTKKNSNENYISDDSNSEMLSATNMHESGPMDDDSDEDTCDVIVEEDENISIFDDDFENLNFMVNIHEDDKLNDTYQPEEDRDDFEFNFKAVSESSETDMHATKNDMHGSTIDIHETFSENSFPGIVFDPKSFNREKVITELIENVCKKYKIPVPKPTQYIPRKRKIRNTEAEVSEPRIKRKRGAEETTLDLMNLYYENINNDIIFQLTEHLKSAFETAESKNTDGPPHNILGNAPSLITEDALNNITENAPNNITDNGLTNIIDDALNDQTDLQNENEISGALEGETNILGDDQIASFNDDNTQADTADSEVDQDEDDGKFNIEEILPKTDPKFDPKTHDIKQLYVNLKDEFDFIDFSEIDNDPDLNDMIDKKIEAFCYLNVNKSHKNGNGIPSQKNYIGNGESQESNESVDDIPCVQEMLLHITFMYTVWLSPVAFFLTQLKVWRREYIQN